MHQDAALQSASEAFAENGYAYVPDFFSEEVRTLAYRYGMRRLQLGNGIREEAPGGITVGTLAEYGDYLMETLLETACVRIEAVTGKALWPTYSFYRLYRQGMDLKPHRDRPACEYSATICLGHDFSNLSAREGEASWPMYADGDPLPCPPGSAIIYRGMEVKHWRDPLHGRHQLQLFLHYVDRDGEWGELCKYDGRPWLAAPLSARVPSVMAALQEKLAARSPAGSGPPNAS